MSDPIFPHGEPPAAAQSITGDTSDGYHTFNELYAYRKAYNALLFNEWASRAIYDVHKSEKHSDGEWCFGGGWFIVVAQTPVGQITNHYKMVDWPLFQVQTREFSAPWDGHTPAVALERLLALAVAPAAALSPTPDDVFWPPKDDVEEHLYEIRHGKNAAYVQEHVEALRDLWRDAGRQESAALSPSEEPKK